MATRKRATRRSDLLGNAVRAGRRALREAERRIPPDVRRQVDRRLKDADKMARAAIKQLQTQVQRASTRSDVNNVLKRIDALTKQARQIALGAGSRAAASRRTTARRAPVKRATAKRSAATRRETTTTAKRAATTTRKSATTTKRKPATRRAAAASRTKTARRAPTPRRRRTAAEDDVVVVPMAEIGEVEIFEVVPEP